MESKKSTGSFAVIPGTMVTHSIGMKAMMMVGMAKTREKMKVHFHLRIDLLWFTPECFESSETM